MPVAIRTPSLNGQPIRRADLLRFTTLEPVTDNVVSGEFGHFTGVQARSNERTACLREVFHTGSEFVAR
jgi:hypothetical protein